MSDQLLSAKDQAQFKQVLKLYEHKQYKKGNKLVDTLIKKYPNHGGT